MRGVHGAGRLRLPFSWHQTKIWQNGLTLWGWAEHVHGDSPVVQNNLGWAWAHAREFQRAEVHARRAAGAWPNNPTVLQTLARIVAAQGRYEESADILRRAVEIAPRWAEARTDLGSVLYEDGEPVKALEQLQRAVRLDPENERAQEYLGRSLLALGRRGDAEVYLRRPAELEGSSAPGTEEARPAPGPVSGGFRPYRRRARALPRPPRRPAGERGRA